MNRVRRLTARLWQLALGQGSKFVVVGLIGYVVDVAVFNLLRLDLIGWDVISGPVAAKVISMAVATIVAWLGNRYWTFREHRRENFWTELVEFSLVAAFGAAIQIGCLALTHYVFGWTSLLADNLSSNVVGFGLATLVRFLLYRHWVFGANRDHRKAVRAAVHDGAETPAD